MKRIGAILLCGILCVGTGSSFAGTVASGYEVGTWKGFKSAAITYTLDDGCAKQFSVALPVFNEFGIPVTFFSVSNWVSSWSSLQNAANQGHEIGSHTVTHATLSGLSTADQTTELANSQSAVNANITTQKCRTIAYPNCTGGNSTLCSQYYIAGRTCSGAINSSSPSDFFSLSSIICGSAGSVSTLANFQTQAASAVSSSGWCVFLVHGIDDDGGYSPLSSTVLRQTAEYFNTNSGTYWVSTFCNVARYIKERNDVSVTVASSSTNSITLQVTDNLDNAIYNYPITIRRALPSGWTSATVMQAGATVGSSIVTINSTKYIVFDVVPDGGTVTLLNPAAYTTGTIDVTTKFQTMDGFGVGITWGNNVLHANSSKTAIYDLLFSDLGLDIVRIRNVYGRSDNSTMDHDRQTYVAAKGRDNTIKFLLTSWSPPASLKDNGSVLGNGDNSNATLVYSGGSFVYDAFASYWLTSFNSYASMGLTADYISIQNEPDYDASWESCRLRPQQETYNGKLLPGYNTCLDKVFAQLGSSAKFLGPEATGVGYNKVQDFVDVLDQSKLSVVAYHLYNGGDTANPDAFNANVQAIAAKYPDKQIWETEFDQCSPLKTAWLMNNCITEGRASGYIHWKGIWTAPDTRALIAVNSGSGYSVNKYYYYFKQFSKYISSGYKRIAAASGSSDIKLSAYLNPANTQMTVILINKGASAQTMVMNFGGISVTSSVIYRTSSSENFVSVGSLGSGNTISLPAQSVSTAVLTVAINQYTITASAGANGSISPSGSATLVQGGSQTYAISAASGYRVGDVSVDGASVGAVTTYTFSNVSANHSISAAFTAVPTYTIAASAGANGSISPAGAVTLSEGGSQTFYIIPGSGYTVDNVVVDGVPAGAVTSYVFSNVTANHSISATFKTAPTYTITASAGANGTISPSGAVTVSEGTSMTFAITPSTGYSIASVTVDGNSVGSPATYTFSNVTANHTISVAFKTASYTITMSAGSNGWIRPGGTASVGYGGSLIDTIIPATGYEVADVLVDGVSVGAVTSYTFHSITANHTISATFSSLTKYQINCGGSASSPYIADQYYSGGTTYSVTSTITTTGVTNPAPQAVYQTERYGAMTYTIPGLISGASYKVRLHFSENYQTATGKRKFNATINGTTVLSSYDIYAETGARYKAVVKEFTATANGSGQIVIAFANVTDNAKIDGIEIIKLVTNAAPTIATAASATPATVTETTTALSVLGGDDNGEANLTYTWEVNGTPPAAVSFSANGTNAAKATVATFVKAGRYYLLAIVTDAGGLTATSYVTVTVEQTPTSISVTPASATVTASATQQFSATAKDQFGTALVTQPVFTWNVNDGGTISGSGLFTAAATAGTFTVTATSGGISGSAGVTVNTAPTIAAEASATPNPVTGTTAALSVLGDDNAGESNLTYAWAVAGTPPAAVAFSSNGVNAAKNTTATFTKAGAYSFLVTVTDAGGLTATSSVAVTVEQTLASIAISPGSASLNVSAAQQFSAICYDQFFLALSAQPPFTWTVNGGGTIDAAGLFTAGTAAGTFTVTATSGGVNATAGVTVVLPNSAPTIQTAASAAPATITAKTTALSALGADDNGESNLTYTWTTTGNPPASVSFSANGTNAAKATTATFSKAGGYSFLVTVTDAGGLTASSPVSVTVQQTLTSMTLSPASASIATSATQQFTATGYDQFGASMGTQPAITWTVSGVGSVSTSGLYSAGTTAGTATITATSGGVSKTASVTVTQPIVYQINCGGSASSPFTADQYYSGGTARSVTSAITTTGVTNPAPQAVYQTERYGAVTYTLPSLTAGASYTVRLHFAELYWTASGKRKFNVAVNGTTVLSSYDIYAATGARYKAVVKEYTATANSSGQIVIKLTNITDNATIEGIQIIKK